MRLIPVLVLITLLLSVPLPTGAQSATPSTASPVPASGDFAGLVDIGDGREMYLMCRGEGSPTVILEAGYGNDADIWDTIALGPNSNETAVFPGVAAFTRVCAYDRPGTGLDFERRGRSDPVPMPRTAADAVDALHALLGAAAIPGPYVLAAHSLGGIIVRLYAATYPDEVVGLVLVDASQEEQNVRFQAALTPEQWAAFERLSAQVPPDLADDPDLERMDLDASFAQLRTAAAAQPLPPLPLVVLTHGVPVGADLPPEVQSVLPPDFPWDTLETVAQELQAELAALVPGARQVIATESGHYIQLQQPQLVIDAVEQVVDAVRDPSTWPLASAAASLVDAQATPIQSGSATQFTPLLDSVLSSPHWFTGSDGQVHLVYELLLTNAIPTPITVSRVEVLDADSGATLVRLSGEALLAAMSLGTSPETSAVVLPPSSTGVVWLDVPLASEGDIPASIAHRLTIDPPPDVPIPDAWLSYTTAPVAVDRRPPVVLGAPLVGAGWAALGSCCDGPHRRALQPIDGRWYLGQRFAIDFNQLDAQNRPGVGDPTLPTSFPHFGQPVLAVADAVVAEAVDRYPDLNVGEPREAVTPENAGGNRVVLDLGEGRFAIYAHLQAGSVAVQPGDRVTRGQPIANVGSSGTTGGPHLHFQVTDRPSIVAGDGLPYVFDRFELTGQTPPLAEVIPYYDTLQPIPITRERTGMRHDELPLGRDVVTFPAAQTATPAASPVAATGDFSGLVDIGGGRRMFLQCRGQGSPTVVLVSGGGNTGGAWTVLPDEGAPPAVLPGVAAFTRVCAYDRPGTALEADPPDDRSRSDPIPQPTTAEGMVADLHALVTAAGVPGPYVLAGHSFGGLVARLYAVTYPDEVGGLVLVDPFSEAVRAAMTPDQWQTWLATNGVPPPDLLASYPEVERIDIDASADEMERAAAAQPLRPLPLVVLSAGRTGEMTPEQITDLPPGYPEALAAALQANAAFVGTLLPDARLMNVADSGHYIQAEHPELVIDAIRQVVDAVRDPARWATPGASPSPAA
jgi:pimeloyl-ACP methyl ester carboxylesterase